MKHKILPLLALFIVALSACEKEDEVSKIAGKEVLMEHDWKYQDVVVDQDFSYTVMGMTMDYDTVYSPLKETPPCQLDFTIQFLANDKFDYTKLDSFCGGDLSQAPNSLWKLDESKSELTLIGFGAAGMLSMDGNSITSLGDTAVYKVIELTDKSFVFEYEMDQAALMESLNFGGFADGFDMEITGTSKIRVSLVSQ